MSLHISHPETVQTCLDARAGPDIWGSVQNYLNILYKIAFTDTKKENRSISCPSAFNVYPTSWQQTRQFAKLILRTSHTTGKMTGQWGTWDQFASPRPILSCAHPLQLPLMANVECQVCCIPKFLKDSSQGKTKIQASPWCFQATFPRSCVDARHFIRHTQLTQCLSM